MIQVSGSVIHNTPASPSTPAALIRTSTLPHFAIAVAIASLTWPRSLTSHCKAKTRASSRIRSADSDSRSERANNSMRALRAAKASAIARPIPRLAPVIQTTLSAKSTMRSSPKERQFRELIIRHLAILWDRNPLPSAFDAPKFQLIHGYRTSPAPELLDLSGVPACYRDIAFPTALAASVFHHDAVQT